MSTTKIDWNTLEDDDNDSDSGEEQPVVIPTEKKDNPSHQQRQRAEDRPDKYSMGSPRNTRTPIDHQAFRLDQLNQLNQIKSNEVWIFIHKSEQYNEIIKKKMQHLPIIKTIQGSRGWDVLITMEQAKIMLGQPDKKYPLFKLGLKNFGDDRGGNRGDRGGYREGRGGDRDGRGGDRKYKGDEGRKFKDDRNYKERSDRGGDRDRDYDHDYDYQNDSQKRKYVPKEEYKEKTSSEVSTESAPVISSEFEFKKKDKNSRHEHRDHKDRNAGFDKRKRQAFGDGIGAFRLKTKQQEAELELSQPNNLVEMTKGSSHIEKETYKKNNDKFEDRLQSPRLRKHDSTPAPFTKKKYRVKDENGTDDKPNNDRNEKQSEQDAKNVDKNIIVEEQKESLQDTKEKKASITQEKKQQPQKKKESAELKKAQSSQQSSPSPTKKSKKPSTNQASKKPSNNPFDAFHK